MVTGYLKVTVLTNNGSSPVADARVSIFAGELFITEVSTDINGAAEKIRLDMPVCGAEISARGYNSVIISGIGVFPQETSLLQINLSPGSGETFADISKIPSSGGEECIRDCPAEYSLFTNDIAIPQKISVHPGGPDEAVKNISVDFREYIKVVCTREVCPYWPQPALEAVIYCQISFALNRIFTGWYADKGFDVTGSGEFDQEYIRGSYIYEKIDLLTDKIFNRYIRQEGHREPYFNKTTDWYPGALRMAEQGYNALEILRNFIGGDIQIVETYNIEGIAEPYPGYPLREGMSGGEVKYIQLCLSKINTNFPGVPAIHDDGYFGPGTAAAVKSFLQYETGIVDKPGWYKIIYQASGIRSAPGATGALRNVGLQNLAMLTLISRLKKQL